MTDYTFLPSFQFSLINNNPETLQLMKDNELLQLENQIDNDNQLINVNNLSKFFNVALKIQTKTNGKEKYIKSNFRKCRESDF